MDLCARILEKFDDCCIERGGEAGEDFRGRGGRLGCCDDVVFDCYRSADERAWDWMSVFWSGVEMQSSRTGRGSNGIFNVVDSCFEPTGLLLRAHMVIISLCAQEESVPRPVERWAHHIL
jgi:hypothetical protein